MKKLFLVLFMLTMCSWALADDISTSMSAQRKAYLNWQYGEAMRTGLDTMDRMFSQIMTNLLAYVPEFQGYSVTGTNMQYEFNGGNGFYEYSFKVGKIMTNEEAVVTLNIVSTPAEIEKFHSLAVSWEFLQNKSDYTKEKVSRKGSDYEYLKLGDSAIMVFIFDKDAVTEEIKSGMLVQLSVTYLKSLSKSSRDKKMSAYMYELVGALKWKSLQAILK